MSDAVVTLVVGPFGAGKSTYIDRHARPRALIADGTQLLDTIQHGPRVYLPRNRALAGELRWQLIRMVAAGPPVEFWVESDRMKRNDRDRILSAFGDHWDRRIIVLLPDPGVAIERARNDTMRPRSSRSGWAAMIQRWYDRYEPVESDEAEYVAIVRDW